MDNLKQWRLIGILAITILGFLLHYVFSWTNSSPVIGLLVPVNESVWEHLKLGYTAVLLFSVYEYSRKIITYNNYYVAKLIGVIALELTIVSIYYGYHFLTTKNILLLDISSYVVGVVICQYFTNSLLQLKPISKTINAISLVAFIVLGILFGLATYYPPHLAMFKDSNSNTFGIHQEK